MPFQEARHDLHDLLVAAGVEHPTLDPGGVPPFVLVGLPESVGGVGSRAGWTCTIPTWIVAPPPGGTDAAAWLLAQLPLVLDALRPASAEVDTYEVSGKECPAYRVERSVTIDNPAC